MIYAHARNLTSGFFTNLLKVHLNVGLRRNVRVLQELGVAESISGDKFVSGSRINAPTAHAQTLTASGCAEFNYDVTL